VQCLDSNMLRVCTIILSFFHCMSQLVFTSSGHAPGLLFRMTLSSFPFYFLLLPRQALNLSFFLHFFFLMSCSPYANHPVPLFLVNLLLVSVVKILGNNNQNCRRLSHWKNQKIKPGFDWFFSVLGLAHLDISLL